MRARPDQRHLAFQHIEELRQFVEAPFAQDPAEPRDAHIVFGRLGHDRTVFLHGHGTELQDRERRAIETKALLAEQHGPRRIQTNRQRDSGHGRHCHDRDADGDGQIEQTLARALSAIQRLDERHVIGRRPGLRDRQRDQPVGRRAIQGGAVHSSCCKFAMRIHGKASKCLFEAAGASHGPVRSRPTVSVQDFEYLKRPIYRGWTPRCAEPGRGRCVSSGLAPLQARSGRERALPFRQARIAGRRSGIERGDMGLGRTNAVARQKESVRAAIERA